MTSIRSFNGHTPRIAGDAWVDVSSVVIGDVEIGSGSSIWPLCVVRGDVQSIRIGQRTNIQDGSVLHVTHDSEFTPGGFPLSVGDDVTVGHKVMLHGCEIGHHCLIGMGSIVMDGALLEPQLILAAGSLVPGGKRLQGGWLWRGSPAQKIRPLSDQELGFLQYAGDNYVKLAVRHRDSD